MVDSGVLYRQEAKFKALLWNLSDSPVQIYNSIEDLVEIAEAENLSKSPEQVIISGLDIIRKSNDLKLSLSDWFNLHIADHIWTTFKNHFTNTHLNLKQVMGPTLQNTPFH